MDEQRRGSWLRWALGGLLVLLVCATLGIGFGVWRNRAHRQQAAIAAIYELDRRALIEYDNGVRVPLRPGSPVQVGEDTSVPPFIEKWLGNDYFRDVTSIHVGRYREEPLNEEQQGELFERIAKFPRMANLTFYMPTRDEDIARLGDLEQIKSVQFEVECPELSDASLKILSQMPALEAIAIPPSAVTNVGLKHLENAHKLHWLSLVVRHVGDGGPEPPAITDEGIAYLGRLRRLRMLSLDVPSMTGQGLEGLRDLGELDYLVIRSGGVTDDDLKHLSSMSKLQRLHLIGATIDGSGFRHLTSLPALENLVLECRGVTDEGIQHIARLTRLKGLYVAGSRLSINGLLALRFASKLERLNIEPAPAGNPADLKRALPYCDVFLGRTRIKPP